LPYQLEDSFAKMKGQNGDNEEYLLFLIGETLLKGADVNAANNRGESCLHNAVYVPLSSASLLFPF